MKQQTTIFLFLFVFFSTFSQQIQYPKRIGWVNAKDHGVKGDGIKDDTDSLLKIIRTYPHQYQTRIIIYLPDGIYKVSDTLNYLSGYWDCGVTLQGQSTNNTIIKLANSAPGFNDPNNPKPLIYTRAGNQAFNMYLFNLTINTGTNNDGVIAVDYITNNLGAIKNVKIISEDGKGYCGLKMSRAWPGPGLIKNVSIQGYRYGIQLGYHEYSMTFENITLSNQSICGLINWGNEAAIRKFKSTNSVPAIINSGQLVILDAQLNGGNSDSSAIINKSFIYARNIKSTGYKTVLNNNGTSYPLNFLSEFCSKNPNTLFPYEGSLMLNLPIKETPEYYNNDTNQWGNARDYGAKPTDLLYAYYNSTDGIRKAFNSGKAVIYFPPNGSNGSSYHIYDTISIPASVKMIIGFDFASITPHNSAKLIVKTNSSDPLFFERIRVSITNLSQRTIVCKHSGFSYDNGPNSGELFVEDIVGSIVPSYPMNMWARQLNTEIQPEGQHNVLNRGGKYWILGQKTEGRAFINQTLSGGFSEILGCLTYPASSFNTSDTISTAFASNDGCISSIMTWASYVSNGVYPVWATETKLGVTKKLKINQVNGDVLYRGGCAPNYLSVILENPIKNASFTESQTIALTVKTNGSGAGTKIDYFDGETLITSLTTSPYSFNWSGAALGKHYIYARLTNSNKDTLYSSMSEIEVYKGTACNNTGKLNMDKWTNLVGGGINTIPTTTTPNQKSYLINFEIPENTGNNYGVRVKGYVCAPFTGNYTFYIAGDDYAQLWLSTDTNPTNKVQIAYTPDWTASREWTKYGSQTSAAKALVAGQTYYIEALLKENGGGDNLAVGWKLPDGTLERPIAGIRLIPFETYTNNNDVFIDNNNIFLYPNPASTDITIESSLINNNALLLIYDSNSKKILEKQINLNKITIKVNTFKNGIYYVIVRKGNIQISKKFIIKK